MKFKLVDEILEMKPGESIRAAMTFDPGEELFRDHFPGFPVVPGVLLTEMMAQAAGKCLEAADRDRGKAMLVKINSASFRRWVSPGQKIIIKSQIQTNQQTYATAKCTAEVDNESAATAEVFFSFIPYGDLSSGYRDEVMEQYLAEQQPENEGSN